MHRGAAVALAVVALLGVDAAPATAQGTPAPGPVVLIGTAGVRWSDTGVQTPQLRGLLEHGAVGVMSVRSVPPEHLPGRRLARRLVRRPRRRHGRALPRTLLRDAADARRPRVRGRLGRLPRSGGRGAGRRAPRPAGRDRRRRRHQDRGRRAGSGHRPGGRRRSRSRRLAGSDPRAGRVGRPVVRRGRADATGHAGARDTSRPARRGRRRRPQRSDEPGSPAPRRRRPDRRRPGGPPAERDHRGGLPRGRCRSGQAATRRRAGAGPRGRQLRRLPAQRLHPTDRAGPVDRRPAHPDLGARPQDAGGRHRLVDDLGRRRRCPGAAAGRPRHPGRDPRPDRRPVLRRRPHGAGPAVRRSARAAGGAPPRRPADGAAGPGDCRPGGGVRPRARRHVPGEPLAVVAGGLPGCRAGRGRARRRARAGRRRPVRSLAPRAGRARRGRRGADGDRPHGRRRDRLPPLADRPHRRSAPRGGPVLRLLQPRLRAGGHRCAVRGGRRGRPAAAGPGAPARRPSRSPHWGRW